MEIEQIDQAPSCRALHASVQLTPLRIVDLADPDPQMYANFHTGSPVALPIFPIRNSTAARTRADDG